eukprot:14380287-Ditylum_brightwellii.AAC.1
MREQFLREEGPCAQGTTLHHFLKSCLGFIRHIQGIHIIIFASPNEEIMDKAIMVLRNVNVDLEVKESIEDYLGMTIEKLSNEGIRIAQPKIIQSIIDEVYIPPNLKTQFHNRLNIRN